MVNRREFIRTSVVLGLIAAGVVSCIVIILQADLKGQSVVARSLLQKNAKTKGLGDALSSLLNNDDVARPVKSRLHALSFAQIMRENNNDVDFLGPVDTLAGRYVGPDGLNDLGDAADISLMNTLSSANQKDADIMNSNDQKDGVGTLFNARDSSDVDETHDMANAASRIDSRSTESLNNMHAKEGDFVRSKTPVADLIPKSPKSQFSVVSGNAGGSDDPSMTSHFDLVHHDGEMRIGQSLENPFKLVHPENTDEDLALGLAPTHTNPDDISHITSDSEAESLLDPSGQQQLSSSSSDKGIWIEPGSNKGYDSFALDSLQIKGEAR